MHVEIGQDCVKVRGRDLFLHSGEIHYFRLKKEEWKDRLDKIREAGLNAISTYIPWNWHEPEEGTFDFTGRTCPEKDLDYFMELTENAGLYLIARPGPWICAEWRNGGIPQWLLDKHPEILCLDSYGKPTRWIKKKAPPISYLHPTYLEYVSKWFDRVCPSIKKRLITKGGNIILVQADNETSYGFHRDPFEVDYNPAVIGEEGKPSAYQCWLEKKYQKVVLLNGRYQTSFSSFSGIDPPRGPAKTCGELIRVLDWIEFKEEIIVGFIRKLIEMFRQREIDVPIYANEPGVFEPPSSIYGKAVYLPTGVDLYPLYLPSEKPVIADIINPIEILKARMPQFPPNAPEFEGGDIVDVPTNSTHLMLRIGVAHGLKWINYYMFAGGANPSSYGTTGESYACNAAIAPDGKLNPRYHVIKRFNDFIRTFEDELILSKKLSDLAIAYYYPYRRLFGAVAKDLQITLGDPQRLHEATLEFQTCLYKCGVNWDLADLEHTALENLQRYNVLVAPLLNFIDEESSSKLVNYVERGGCLLIFPAVPSMDSKFEPSLKLQELSGVNTLGSTEEWAWMRFLGMPLKRQSYRFQKLRPEVESIALTEEQEDIVATMRRYGKGKVVTLGFHLTEDYYGLKCCNRLLKYLNVVKHSYGSNTNVHVVERTATEKFGSGFAFVTNLSSDDALTEVKLTSISPFQVKAQLIPKRSGLVWPLERSLKPWGKIVYMTSEVTNITTSRSKTIIDAWGYKGTEGQLLMHVTVLPKRLEGAKFEFDRRRKVLHAGYLHRKRGRVQILFKDHEIRIDLDGLIQPSDYA